MGRQNYRGTTQLKACGAYAHKANTLLTDNGVCRVPLPSRLTGPAPKGNATHATQGRFQPRRPSLCTLFRVR